MIGGKSLKPIVSPSNLFCGRLIDRVDTLRCQIGVLGLSLRLSRNIGDLPNGPRAGLLKIFGGAKRYVCSPTFSDGGAAAPPAPPLPPPLNGAPARTFCLPMWSRRIEFSWYTYEDSCRKLSSFKVSGAPMQTRFPAGPPLSELWPMIKGRSLIINAGPRLTDGWSHGRRRALSC